MKLSFESAKGVSFRDVLKHHLFSGVREIDLLSPEMDDKVFPILHWLGIDNSRRIDVQACWHRTLDGTKVCGYRYVGFERIDKEWLDSAKSTMAARLASQKDISLAAEMKGMSTEGMSGSAYMAMCTKALEGDSPDNKTGSVETEDTWEDSVAQIKVLQEIQQRVRGTLTIDEDTLKTTY